MENGIYLVMNIMCHSKLSTFFNIHIKFIWMSKWNVKILEWIMDYIRPTFLKDDERGIQNKRVRTTSGGASN